MRENFPKNKIQATGASHFVDIPLSSGYIFRPRSAGKPRPADLIFSAASAAIGDIPSKEIVL